MTLILPFVATTAQLLLDTSDYPMPLLESQIDSYALSLSVFLAKRPCICPIAVFASNLQSVPFGTIFAKVTLAFPLLAFSAEFLLATIDGTVRLLVAVVSLCHSLAAEPISIAQSLSQKP